MGPALLSTLAEELANDWTPDVEKAWNTLFVSIAETMATAIQEGMDHGGKSLELIAALGQRMETEEIGHVLSTKLAASVPELLRPTQPVRPPSTLRTTTTVTMVETPLRFLPL